MYYSNYNGNNYNNSGNSNGSNGSDGPSWILIIFLLAIGAWPISLILTVMKLSRQPNAVRQTPPPLHEEKPKAAPVEKDSLFDILKKKIGSLKDGRLGPVILEALGLLIAFIGMLITIGIASDFVLTFGNILGFIYGLATLAGGGFLFANGFNSIRAIKRFSQYAAIIGSKQAMRISDIASKTGISEKRVLSDLKTLIARGCFGKTAYINMELGYFFMSSEADEELMNLREAAMKKAREASQKESAKHEADVYEDTLRQIRELNDRIDSPEVSQKIDRLEEITREIFKAVQKDPSKVAKIDRFMSYYLPSTLKILDSYERLEETNISGENVSKGMKSIEDTMDSIVSGFEKQLDKLYKTDTLDIETDLDVMQQLMAQENRGSDFTPSASAAAVQKK